MAPSFDTIDLLDGNIFQVTWDLGRRCNYNCSYCPSHRHDNFSTHASFEDLKKSGEFAFKYIALYMKYRSFKSASINFTGGEPTVNPNFIKFAEYINDLYKKEYAHLYECLMSVTSNGAMSKKVADAVIVYFDHITVSYHAEASAALKEQVRDRILQFSQQSSKNRLNLSINVMFHAEYFEECKALCEFFDKKKINYVPRIIGEDPDSAPSFAHKYTPGQLEWLKNYWSKNTSEVQNV